MLRVYNTDALAALREMPDESVHCVVTSPPYFGLRDYGLEPTAWDGDPNCEHDWNDKSYKRRANDSKPGDLQGNGSLDRDIPALCALCALCGAWRGCFGLEPTPDLYIQHTVQIMREIRRVLRPDGTVWWNIGDSYAGSWGNYGGQNRGNGMQREIVSGSQVPNPAYAGLEKNRPPTANVKRFRPGAGRADGIVDERGQRNRNGIPCPPGLKAKDLCMIPARVALALQADGWWLRSEIIWAKPAPMPESVTDRPTRSHEQIYIFTKSDRYFYDHHAVRQRLKQSSVERLSQDVESQAGSSRANGGAKSNGNIKAACFGGRLKSQINDQTRLASGNEWQQDVEQGANLRDVWTINTEGFRDAHFAVFPTEIPRRCILAGTSARGVCPECGAPWTRVVEQTGVVHRREPAHVPNNTSTKVDSTGWKPATLGTSQWRPSCEHGHDPIPATVLDPFAGSGTTGKVAIELGRKAILIEPKAEYCEMIDKRTKTNIGLPLA